MEELLKGYYDPANPGSYGGVDRLFRSLKSQGYSRDDVKKFLAGQETYQLHRDKRLRFQRNPVVSFSKDWNWQADLVDLSKLAKHNHGYKYILMVIDVFTKYAWARCLKKKEAGDIKRAFENIFELDGRKPVRLQTDRGTEFVSWYMRDFFKDNDIYFFTSYTSTFKCAVVERLNRTIKSRMFRYFTKNGTKCYVHILQKIIDSYNNSYHTSIKMTPVEACSADSKQVFSNLYGRALLKKKTAKLASGDYLRLARDKSTFDKAYEQSFSKGIARLVRLSTVGPTPLYQVTDIDGTPLKRRFYGDELQKIDDPVADKVIKRRGGKDLVTFKNYQGEHWLKHG